MRNTSELTRLLQKTAGLVAITERYGSRESKNQRNRLLIGQGQLLLARDFADSPLS